jgi:hypothetical protein
VYPFDARIWTLSWKTPVSILSEDVLSSRPLNRQLLAEVKPPATLLRSNDSANGRRAATRPKTTRATPAMLVLVGIPGGAGRRGCWCSRSGCNSATAGSAENFLCSFRRYPTVAENGRRVALRRWSRWLLVVVSKPVTHIASC